MLADYIATMIEEMLNRGDGILELKRNEMANQIGCVPSQISYVIASRFTPERGYVIESHRGGGGYIRITRKRMDRNEYLMHFFCAIGDEIDEAEAIAYLKNLLGNELMTEREVKLAAASMSNNALSDLPHHLRKIVRAQIFKQILLAMI